MIQLQGAKQFTVDLDAFAKHLAIARQTVVRRITLELWNSITKRTPVDTGRASSSWNLAIGRPDPSVPAEGYYGPPATPSVANVTGNEEVWITSNLVYIEPLEHGHSKQAPTGMVMVSVAETQARIEGIMGGLK